ncbi:undecaprenyl-diphosphatase [Verrucomicrobium sp. GAS474]|uniref:phosphatase PAP2 family protein n=1 Tax=Verrucomicrobium sp. GAS474 TaxID=1882831 RepID=UPI00087B3CB8|nr:phosphatase PAP2 family protein [Verrucomicrobium sp. GAS474]SDT98147.1 undecaprenyl-diphosphatase [Verrucomicrobium sp. GAS474]
MHALLQTLSSWDIALLFRINGAWSSAFLDPVMLAVSSPKFFAIPIAAGVVALAIWGGFKGRTFLVLLALSIALGDGVIDNWGKKIVHRPRPNEALEGVRIAEQAGVGEGIAVRWAWPRAEPGGRSFPSGHVFNNVALAFLACVVWGGRRFGWVWIVWLWAALVSYSRVYLGAHYPSDVLGSLLLALGYLWGIVFVARVLWRRWAPRIAPRLAQAHPELV